jgi:hypothetical protein
MNKTQMEFEAEGKAPSQTDRLIQVLHNANNRWVDLPTLVARVGGYAIHSRAADARKMGVNVENYTINNPYTGKRESFYRLQAP